jgi:hypothetical protein
MKFIIEGTIAIAGEKVQDDQRRHQVSIIAAIEYVEERLKRRGK